MRETQEHIYARLVSASVDVRDIAARLAALHETLLHTERWDRRDATHRAHQACLTALDALYAAQGALAGDADAGDAG